MVQQTGRTTESIAGRMDQQQVALYRDAAQRWLAVDPDPDTKAELQRLLERGDEVALDERFGERLTFGTAGLRGALGAGPNRMNRVVVRQAAMGLMQTLDLGARVVIGYDARHKSDVFARRHRGGGGSDRAAGPSCCLAPCRRPCSRSRCGISRLRRA